VRNSSEKKDGANSFEVCPIGWFWKVMRVGLVDGLMESEVAGGCANAYGSLARGRDPFLIFGGPVLELARGYMECDGF